MALFVIVFVFSFHTFIENQYKDMLWSHILEFVQVLIFCRFRPTNENVEQGADVIVAYFPKEYKVSLFVPLTL